MTFELVIVGGGNMGSALLGGMLHARVVAPSEVAVVEVYESRRAQLASEFPGVTVSATIPECASAVVAVKPPEVADVVAALAAAGTQRVLSIAAGVTIDAIQRAAGRDLAVLRTMPNTPALVGQGVSALSAGPTATEADVDWAEQILAGVGTVVRVAEHQLDAVTGLTGSGPAYLFLVAEALIDGGVLAGLPRPTVELMVAQLLVGSATLLAERGDAAGLRAMVTSPAGTTAAGLQVLEQRGTRAAFIDAVQAATDRSRELGRS